MPRRAKIMLLGDSITQQAHSASGTGWAAHLADVYQRRADVMNRGFSGYNTDWFLRLVKTADGRDDVFDHDGVRLAVVFFGANDASCVKLNPRHHVPVDRYAANLEEIVSLCRRHYGDKCRIVMVCPPPVHHPSRLAFQVQRYGDKATGDLERTLELSGRYAAAAAKVAASLSLPCLNLWEAMQAAAPGADEPWSKFLSDGLHFSGEGNAFVGRCVAELLARELPELAVVPDPHTGAFGNSGTACAGLTQVGPWHDYIDHEAPEKAFA